MEKKSFGVALVIWFFLGGLGGHRIYIQEKPTVILWYWLATVFSLGIIVLVDLFFLHSMIERENMKKQINKLQKG